MKVIYTAEAKQDVRDIVSYYEREQVGLGDQFLGALTGTIELLREFPLSSRKIGQGVRRAVFPKPFLYNLYYSPNRAQNTLLILAVAHQRRHPDAWKR
ncbi:MAG: type II toxin-antitoxin system RelE/ParE family toxin [Acidobacteriota bacterium]|nr:type II toxin-antitoxin system RelE/ParE family toxin [Acidobacteriota bacterium]